MTWYSLDGGGDFDFAGRIPGPFGPGLGGGGSPDGEAGISRDVAADVGGEHAGLDFEHSAVGHFVAEDGVGDDGGLSLFVGLEEAFAAGFGELAGAAPGEEVAGGEGGVVDEGEDDGIGDDGPPLFHQIQCEGGFAVAVDVVEAAIGVEADGAEGREAVFKK